MTHTLHDNVTHDGADEVVAEGTEVPPLVAPDADDGADEDADMPPLVAPDPDVLPGDSVEVWWDEEGKFFPCVVKGQAPDTNDTTASECLYDGETNTFWHDLEAEEYRHIPPTVERLSKLSVKAIKKRLRMEGQTVDTSKRKVWW